MHSRIIELSKDPILKHERMCESSVHGHSNESHGRSNVHWQQL